MQKVSLKPPAAKMVQLTDIVRDARFQVRVRICQRTVGEYAESLAAGGKFPPVVLYRIESKLFLVDGFHRLEASERAGKKEIQAAIIEGTLAEALKAAFLANQVHGLRLTNRDKRRAAELAIRAFPDLSDRALAEIAKVGNDLIGAARRFLLSENDSSAGTRVGRNGKTYRATNRKTATPPAVARPDISGAETLADKVLEPQQAHALLLDYLERTRREAAEMLNKLPANLARALVQNFKLLTKQFDEVYRASLATSNSNNNNPEPKHENPTTNQHK